jgi:hypothetical protein
MDIDVQDPLQDLLLIIGFFAVQAMALFVIVPWETFGWNRISRLATGLPVAALAAAIVYDATMPARYDISRRGDADSQPGDPRGCVAGSGRVDMHRRTFADAVRRPRPRQQ